MPSDMSIPISQTIPWTITLAASGTSHVHAFVLQPDCDCYVQFFEADGTTAMTGKIHIPQYDTLTSAVQGGGLLLSSAGIKLTVSGNTSGSLNGFVAVNKD